jgi:phosphatidate phosphatase APP1
VSAKLTPVDNNSSRDSSERAEKVHRASALEDQVQRLRCRWARSLGHTTHIMPFTGYGSEGWIRVLSRVLLLKPRPSITGKQRKVRGWRSFTGVPVAGAIVTIHIGEEEFEVTADRGGVIDQVIPVDLPPGWHTITLASDDSLPVAARIRVVPETADLGIICDIDDTVMVTALPRPLLAAWNSFVRDENARRPVPGMAVLLDRLQRDNPDAPVVYLSTGAWNVAATLTRFLSRHLYPLGPLLLTDWGPTHDRWFRSGRAHKRHNLQRLAAEFPHLKWILIGDDGQHDENLYAELAMARPESVRAIAIRELLAPEALLAGGRRHFDRTHNPLTIPWVSAPNGAGLASELRKLGILDES